MQDVTKDRNKYIGGSDIPIIMGISQFKTRFDLLLEKAEQKENDFTGNEYTEYGNVLEPKIRDYINSIDKYIAFKEDKKINGDIRCHVDGYNGVEVLEIKTTSQIYKDVDDYMVYLVQLLFYMNELNSDLGVLAVYERPSDFNEEFDKDRLTTYEVKRSDYTNLIEKIYKEIDNFRNDLEKVKNNPLMTEEELLPNTLTSVSNALIQVEEQLKAFDELNKKQKELKEQLKNLMQEYGVTKWTTNNGTKITLVKDSEDKVVRKFNEKLFKENNQDLWDEYSEETIQKGKAGYVRITLKEEE